MKHLYYIYNNIYSSYLFTYLIIKLKLVQCIKKEKNKIKS